MLAWNRAHTRERSERKREREMPPCTKRGSKSRSSQYWSKHITQNASSIVCHLVNCVCHIARSFLWMCARHLRERVRAASIQRQDLRRCVRARHHIQRHREVPCRRHHHLCWHSRSSGCVAYPGTMPVRSCSALAESANTTLCINMITDRHRAPAYCTRQACTSQRALTTSATVVSSTHL
jgi:hypothetical protein